MLTSSNIVLKFLQNLELLCIACMGCVYSISQYRFTVNGVNTKIHNLVHVVCVCVIITSLVRSDFC